MATTYTELQSEIANFLNRDDLAAVIPTFIQLAESQINRDIRHWRMEERQEATADEQYLTKPSDWVETIRMNIQGNGTSVINMLSQDALATKRARNENTAGTPKYYCHAGNALELYPTPDSNTAIEMLYYGKIPALSGSNASNWLLEDAPDLYLYGALMHSAGYLQEDARVALWVQFYGSAVTKLNEESEKAKYSGTGLKLKVRGLG